MNILMITNTFTPHVGGVARSVELFSRSYSQFGHNVLVISPEFKGSSIDEPGVIRVPAIQQFNGSDFSVRLPIPAQIISRLDAFKPDIAHSHHPFLLGYTAIRIAHHYGMPIVFTHHTRYEDYTHYAPGDSLALKRFVVQLSTGYCNLCDQVFAPSQSIADLLALQGVTTPISVVPTGVDGTLYATASGSRFRQEHKIPEDAYVVGHVGRLAPEKNLSFLVKAVRQYLLKNERAWFLVVGNGPSAAEIKTLFSEGELNGRICLTGSLSGQELVDAYHAMDVFAFSSKTETQGMVLVEAMTAGIPVVALDASGVREVVRDRINGCLLNSEDEEAFSAALHWISTCNPNQRNSVIREVRKTAAQYSTEHTAKNALQCYQSLAKKKYVRKDISNSIWENALEKVKTEWKLIHNTTGAAQVALGLRSVYEGSDEPYQEPLLVKFKRWFSRTELAIRLLNLTKSFGTETRPGLVLIQIDGFSLTQLKRALKDGEMPFLHSLLRQGGYSVYPFYSGLPASTPAVQGELFYSVKGIVPAFSFFDSSSRTIFKMYDDESALEIERRLKEKNCGLLEGGSSYCNIYSGGARESHYCSINLGWDQFWKGIRLPRLGLLLLTQATGIIRTTLRMVIETIIGLYDAVNGVLAGMNFGKELKFIPTRSLICILLRDLITFGAKVDIKRGLPVIHMNFIGYDEQAHRRGPSSRFAHRALRGIDAAIARIYKLALRSIRRDYHVWIYSDHGQEDTLSYTVVHGKTIQETVSELFQELHAHTELKYRDKTGGTEFHRLQLLGGQILPKLLRFFPPLISAVKDSGVVVTAMGPIGHVYLPESLDPFQISQFAQRLVDFGKVPLVLVPEKPGEVTAWNERGKFNLPDQAAEVLGKPHPHLVEAATDLVNLCHHPHAGSLILSGWRPGEKPFSFPIEGGAHAGPGSEETNPFVLLPSEVNVSWINREKFRPHDLRELVMGCLGRNEEGMEIRSSRKKPCIAPHNNHSIRIMTYNIHRSIGMDGKISPERIARVIGRHHPDIVALQEVDFRTLPSKAVNQAHIIAENLQMNIVYRTLSPKNGQPHYGNAVLCRYPVRLIQAEIFPDFTRYSGVRPGNALWCLIPLKDERNLQVFNIHLSASRYQRKKEAEILSGDDWIRNPLCTGPVIVAGDFNATNLSKPCRSFRRILQDAQSGIEESQGFGQWLRKFFPGTIDHVFVNSCLKTIRIKVSKTDIDQIASDHLPLFADVTIQPNGKE